MTSSENYSQEDYMTDSSSASASAETTQHGTNTRPYVEREHLVETVEETGQVTVGSISGTIYPIKSLTSEIGGRTTVSHKTLTTYREDQNQRLVSTVDTVGATEIRKTMGKQIVRIPKKVVREEVHERIFVVPEVVTIEAFEEDEIEVDEEIVETRQKIKREKVIEVPEIEEVQVIIEEEVVNLMERIVEQEKIIPVEKIETRQVRKEIEVIQEVEKVEKVHQPYINLTPDEKVTKTEKVACQQVKPIVTKVDVEKRVFEAQAFPAQVVSPNPVEAITTVTFNMPAIVPKAQKKKYPVFLPRFIEVPVSRQFASEQFLKTQEKGGLYANTSVLDKLHVLMNTEAASLCEIENFAHEQLPFLKDMEETLEKERRAEIIGEKWRQMIDHSGQQAFTSMNATVAARGGVNLESSSYQYTTTTTTTNLPSNFPYVTVKDM